MSYRRDGDRITLEISAEQFESLNLALAMAIATNGKIPDAMRSAYEARFQALASAINEERPGWRNPLISGLVAS
jgi:hypothetical protein